MNGKLKYLGFLTSLSVGLLGLPGLAAAQQAVLYEIVENIDVVQFANYHRVSFWTAQGSAQAGSPFCPLPVGSPRCTITAFGMDDINLATLTGTVWANIAAVANPDNDNPVDGAEAPFFTGQITGDITILAPGGSVVVPDLNKNKKVLGPLLPLLYVTSGKFFRDGFPTVRTRPGDLPTSGHTATFNSTFRLPFKVGRNGNAEKVERGKNAYYLADNGDLIKADKQDEYALGFPLLRADVFFTSP